MRPDVRVYLRSGNHKCCLPSMEQNCFYLQRQQLISLPGMLIISFFCEISSLALKRTLRSSRNGKQTVTLAAVVNPTVNFLPIIAYQKTDLHQDCEGTNGQWEKSGDLGQCWTPDPVGDWDQCARGGDSGG